MGQPLSWWERVSPWDAWLAFLLLVAVSVYVLLGESGIPTWGRWAVAGILTYLGLMFALAETRDRRRNRQ